MSLVCSRTRGEHTGRGKSRVLVIFMTRIYTYSTSEKKDVLNEKKNSKDGNKRNREKIRLEGTDEGEMGWNVYKFK